jgi:hypothetical protein
LNFGPKVLHFVRTQMFEGVATVFGMRFRGHRPFASHGAPESLIEDPNRLGTPSLRNERWRTLVEYKPSSKLPFWVGADARLLGRVRGGIGLLVDRQKPGAMNEPGFAGAHSKFARSALFLRLCIPPGPSGRSTHPWLCAPDN